MSTVEIKEMPEGLVEALSASLQNKNIEEAQHHAVHMIGLLSDAAVRLAEVNNKTALGTDTLKGVLAAINQQLGVLEAPSHTKQ